MGLQLALVLVLDRLSLECLIVIQRRARRASTCAVHWHGMPWHHAHHSEPRGRQTRCKPRLSVVPPCPIPCARRERDGDEISSACQGELHVCSNAPATKRVFNAHVPARTSVVAVYVYASPVQRAKCPYILWWLGASVRYKCLRRYASPPPVGPFRA